jgi:hypothetical protein
LGVILRRVKTPFRPVDEGALERGGVIDLL